jgi:ribonucleoside-diphosphate reductase alpha chain
MMPATSTLQSSGTDSVPSALSQGSETASEPGYRVIRRNGAVTPFDATKITVALTKAFLATEGSVAAGSRRVHDVVEELAGQVFAALTRRADSGRTFHIEEIQDQVELALMRSEHHKVARAYVLYREERARERAAAKVTSVEVPAPPLQVKADDGGLAPLNETRLARIVDEACSGLEAVSADAILAETRRNLYDGITADELALAPILAARTLVETEPNYAYRQRPVVAGPVAARGTELRLGQVRAGHPGRNGQRYATYFPAFIATGIKAELIDPELGRFDLAGSVPGAQARARPSVPVSGSADAL